MAQARYSVGEVVELVGITRRTLHFYVQLGLIPRPHGGGRGHFYTDEHLRRLALVKDLQSQGLSLNEIAQRVAGTGVLPLDAKPCSDRSIRSQQSAKQAISESDDRPKPAIWTHIEVADGIELHLRGGIRQMTPSRLEKVRQAVRRALGTTD